MQAVIALLDEEKIPIDDYSSSEHGLIMTKFITRGYLAIQIIIASILIYFMRKGKKEERWVSLNLANHILWSIVIAFVTQLSFKRFLTIFRKLSKIKKAADMLNEDCSDRFIVIPEDMYSRYNTQFYQSITVAGLSVILAMLYIGSVVVNIQYRAQR